MPTAFPLLVLRLNATLPQKNQLQSRGIAWRYEKTRESQGNIIMRIWAFYVLSLAFSAYWASNLVLWFPWSYSPALGITMMLTVTPLLWAYVTILGLRAYPEKNIKFAAFILAAVFLSVAIVADYIFFGLIRGGLEDLYQPTTFYGYGFLIFWPIAIATIFSKQIHCTMYLLKRKNIPHAIIPGAGCLVALILIIKFNIKLL